MTTSATVSSRQKLVALLEQVLDTPEKQQAFVDASLFGVPKLLAQIKAGQAARVFAIHLVTSCMAYGKTQGKPTITLLLDELADWLGDEHQLEIASLRRAFAPQSSVATATQAQTVQQVQETDALIEQFYAAYQHQQWDAALAVLERLAQVPDLPRLFNLAAYQHELQGQTKELKQVKERDREYRLLKLKMQAEPPERVWEGLKALWQVYPGYDPDGLTDWVFAEDRRYREAVSRIAQAYHHNQDTLNLNDLGLEVLPSAIGYLENLRWLSCANNLLVTLPPEIGSLPNLQTIHAENNHINSLPDSLMRLANLRSLFFNHNRIMNLPKDIHNFTELEVLDMRQNRLHDLPEGLAQLRRLSVLVLDHNHLAELPPFLFTLRRLTWLLAADNEITVIPPEIESLQRLRLLSLSYNALRDLPMTLGNLPHLDTLFVTRGNPLDQLPREVVEGGNKRVLSWLRAQY